MLLAEYYALKIFCEYEYKYFMGFTLTEKIMLNTDNRIELIRYHDADEDALLMWFTLTRLKVLGTH
ncbi:hypothetical protein BTN50_2058 [Candidatus Enterovibrio altilux]|uniref:Uncharacterized protein n=1 Tax=Candidatus Enterovibrio altilux TaxID=1927128 RepID=A0A291BBU6_9GAMM|nr:hypothetical protein BTN50_2058 [Candidatus Enterovibrio luxaltus]